MVKLDFEKCGGLIPAVAQDHKTGEILMLAYISPESWAETLRSGYATYYSRSRQELQKIMQILVDCDADTVVFKVEQIGNIACHTGNRSCFYREVTADGSLQEI